MANIPGLECRESGGGDSAELFGREEDSKSVAAAVAVTAPAPSQPKSYFCLLRDRFRARPEFKITIPELEDEVAEWHRACAGSNLRNECSPDSSWINWVVSWKDQVIMPEGHLIRRLYLQ